MIQGLELLKSKNVVVVGAGGLGCGLLYYLAGAGIGEICVCDCDTVNVQNLDRQILYSSRDVGRKKVDAALERLSLFSPQTCFVGIDERICDENAAQLTEGTDLLIAACDNLETRLALNRACSMHSVPLLNVGIEGLFASVYLCLPHKTACLECIYGDVRESRDKRTVGAAAGAAGAFAALTAIKYLCDDPDVKAGELILFDMNEPEIKTLPIKKTHDCAVCGDFAGNVDSGNCSH